MYFKMFPDGRVAVPTYVLIEVSGSEQVLSVFILRKKKIKKSNNSSVFQSSVVYEPLFDRMLSRNLYFFIISIHLRQINTTS